MSTLFLFLIILLLIVLIIRIFRKPVRFLLKLIFNTVFGFIILLLINHFGSCIGISLPPDIPSSLIVGFLGLPGVIILLLFHNLL